MGKKKSTEALALKSRKLKSIEEHIREDLTNRTTPEEMSKVKLKLVKLS
ncbi:MAG: hypothetical protein GT597_14120 [Bacteroidales bacterium]|nr:hypothetical protein [Bacteroidales bacterium]NMA31171.1 hypothetical protein [Candidatus Methanofastidiosa archaeon]